MAISITSLSPAKNDTAVPVNSDIEITLSSDSADLDVQTTKFIINGIEVKPSAYYGVDNSEVEVSFFARKRIRYNTGRRYGQDDLRYGMRDDIPSSFQYGQRYVCTIYIEDVDGNVFEENFSFTVEEGIFYNSNPVESFYHYQTQAYANYLPSWARARYDKYSNFQQYLNSVGKYIQEIEDFLFKQTSNYYVQTSNLNELATLYKISLGGNFSFQTTVLDDGTRLQIPPDVSAIKEITKFHPVAEFQNDLKTFYYEKLPTRIESTKFTVSSLEILSQSPIDNSVVKIDRDLERAGRFSITVGGAGSFVEIKNQDFKFLTCRITGVSREKKKQIEDIIFIDNDVYYTTKLWRHIESIQFINVPKGFTGNFSVDHVKPPRSFVSDSYNYVDGIEDLEKPIFWKPEDSAYGTVLQQWSLLKVDPEEIITSIGEKDLVGEYELLDIDGQTNLNLTDIDVDNFTNFLYGIDDEYLYIFDKREEYPSIIKSLSPENGKANFVVDLDSDNLGRGDSTKEISIVCRQMDESKSVSQYRLSVLKPDGSVQYILQDNTFTTDKNNALTVVPLVNELYQTQAFSYELDLVGDYLIKVEAIYRNGTSSVDSKIARVGKKSALSKYKLERIFGEATPTRFFIDFDQQLKVLDTENQLHTISFVRDNMLIDYNNAIVYFSEEYDEVEVDG